MNNIFEKLPNHLHLCRNSNADKFDRWRLFNNASGKYLDKTGGETAEICMSRYLELKKQEKI